MYEQKAENAGLSDQTKEKNKKTPEIAQIKNQLYQQNRYVCKFNLASLFLPMHVWRRIPPIIS